MKKFKKEGKKGSKQLVTGPFKIKQVRRQVKQEKVDQWPPYATRRNLIQVSTRHTCAVLHKGFEPRRQLEPKGLRKGWRDGETRRNGERNRWVAWVRQLKVRPGAETRHQICKVPLRKRTFTVFFCNAFFFPPMAVRAMTAPTVVQLRKTTKKISKTWKTKQQHQTKQTQTKHKPKHNQAPKNISRSTRVRQ